MEPGDWAPLAGVLVTVVAAGFAWWQAKTARRALAETKRTRQIASDQAESARESATAASKSADAATWQAKNAEMQTQLARAEYDRADRPRFEITAEPVRDDWVVVRARVVDSPAMLSVTVDWIAKAIIPAGAIAEETKICLAARPEKYEHVAKNENLTFGLAVSSDAVRGEIRLSLSCAEQDGDRSWQPVPETVRWRRREAYGVHMA